MSKKNGRSLAFLFSSFLLVSSALTFIGCDRGASAQVQAAERFSDALTRNEGPRRDSMIATYKFKEYFTNQYVAADFLQWFRSFYNLQEKKFNLTARADVDRDLKKDLEGGLIDNAPVEETGVVRVKVPNDDEHSAYFWMVRHKGGTWKVAIVTKGELAVKFHEE